MRLDFSEERMLAVVAHPDDAELLCAGALARARADGAAIGICVLCQGDKGQSTPPVADLVEVRRREMTEAAKLLGAELLLGDFPDAGLFDGPEERQQLIELYRRFRPTLVLAHFPGDYHADHRAAAELAEAVSWFSASAGHQTASPPLDMPPALWWMDAVEMSGFLPQFYLDITSYVDLKQQMLACYRSQLARGSERAFSPLQEVMLRQCQTRGAQAGVAAAEAFQAHQSWKRARAW